ncbi:hypothetical protein SAMN05444355_11521 [Flavobacterium frigoris]|uniref:Uncharacterized protein n=1 Tax=Flavobacterium frigoris TaxID=229204 RepID=A0A1H9Q3X9_FLAFI|nr:hypothetical protein SAMN05444355_11521 [Flavobacterium frigoris]
MGSNHVFFKELKYRYNKPIYYVIIVYQTTKTVLLKKNTNVNNYISTYNENNIYSYEKKHSNLFQRIVLHK